MSATTTDRAQLIRLLDESIKPSLVNMPITFRELITQSDVSDLISPITQEYPFGFKDLKAYEALVGAGIGIKAIASFPTNFKIMVTHGEVQLRHYLRLDEDSDLLSPSAIKILTAGVPIDLVADIVTIEEGYVVPCDRCIHLPVTYPNLGNPCKVSKVVVVKRKKP